MGKPNEGRSRVVIENVEPQLNCGRFPIKRIVDDLVSVEADVFGDGHDEVRARLLWKQEGDTVWQTTEMRPLANDRWQGEFPVKRVGRCHYTLVGEIDHFGTWRSDLKKRISGAAGSRTAVCNRCNSSRPGAGPGHERKTAQNCQPGRRPSGRGAKTPQRLTSRCRKSLRQR